MCDDLVRRQVIINTNEIRSLKDDVKQLDVAIEKMKSNQSTTKQVVENQIMQKVEEQLNNFAAEISVKLASVTQSSNNTQSASHGMNRRKNVMIRGVPYSENEDVTAIVKEVAKVINFKKNNYIDNCFRLPSKDVPLNVANPGSILLKFNSEIMRDNFIRCYFSFIKNHQLTVSSIGYDGSSRVFVNEHMDPKLKLVLSKALTMRKQNILSAVSAHCNHVSVKTNKGWHRIYTEADLDRATSVMR